MKCIAPNPMELSLIATSSFYAANLSNSPFRAKLKLMSNHIQNTVFITLLFKVLVRVASCCGLQIICFQVSFFSSLFLFHVYCCIVYHYVDSKLSFNPLHFPHCLRYKIISTVLSTHCGRIMWGMKILVSQSKCITFCFPRG